MGGITICIHENEAVGPRKITRIMPYSGGGFAMVLPYHSAKQGYLFKHPVHYGAGYYSTIKRDEMVTYTSARLWPFAEEIRQAD